MVIIDGAQGEGGGQILRSSLALSLVTGKPVTVHGIRARRKKPGLMRQHLTAVDAAATVGAAKVSGAALGSRGLCFTPERVTPGEYRFSVGTAGSCTLVLQTVLPALMTADGASRLTLEGGTHNPMAPPYDFLAETFLPVLERMGPCVTPALVRPGFYPAGGGCFTVDIAPSKRLTPLVLEERGALRRCSARAVVANLPEDIAHRELKTVHEELRWPWENLRTQEIADGPGPGNVLMLTVESEALTEVFTGFGQRGVPARQVARRAVGLVRTYLDAGVPVGPFLADQLLIPMAMAGGGVFRTVAPTLHLKTNMDVVRRFLDVDIALTEHGANDWRVVAEG